MRFIGTPSFIIALVIIVISTLADSAFAQIDTFAAANISTSGDANCEQVVMLRYDMPTEWNRHTPNATTREFIRQAILIAARDGLSIPTRDITLREEIIASYHPLDIDINAVWKQPWIVTVTRKDNPHGKESWKDTIVVESPGNIRQLVQAVEQRSRDQYITHLNEMGFQGYPVKQNPDATIPPRVMEQLDEMNFISQFAAVRQIHETIALQGESPELLAGLVRGYANLGQLTRPIMNGTCKAFRARAILYAHRLMHLDNDSQFAHSHLAYAWFMAGWHSRAISEIERIKEVDAQRARQRGEEPDYQPTLLEQIITLYVSYDTKGLQNLVDRSSRYRPLIDFLAFLTIKYRANETMLLEAGNHLLYTTNPRCYRIADEMNQVKRSRSLVRRGSELFDSMLQVNLSMVDSLPQQALSHIEDNRNKSQATHLNARNITDALIAAGQIENDFSPASWQILGRMIEETNFRIIWWHAHIFGKNWNLKINSNLHQVDQVIKDHPYAPLLKMYRLDTQQDKQQYYQAVQDVVIRDASINMYPMMGLGWHFGKDQYNPCVRQWHQLFLFKDWVADDLVVGIQYHNVDQAIIDYAAALNKVSPNCPYAIATLINREPDNQRQHFEQYRREHAKNPVVMRALAKVYIKDENWSKATWCLEKHLIVEPDHWTYENLADVYLQQGDQKAWKQTLDTYLKRFSDEDQHHINIRVKIAEHYIQQGDFLTAMPYAMQAAQYDYGKDGALCVIKCSEALGDYETAEKWARHLSGRYRLTRMDWYYWCIRTGRGDLQAAKVSVEKYLRQYQDKPHRFDLIQKACYALLENDSQQAYEIFKEAHSITPRPYTGLHLYLYALENQDGDIMRSAVQATRRHVQAGSGWPVHKIQVKLLELFNQHQQQGGSFDYQQADQIIREGDEECYMTLSYFTAKYLEQIDIESQAVKYYKQAVSSSAIDHANSAMAAFELRKRGIEPPLWFKSITLPAKPVAPKPRAPAAPL